MIQSVPGMPRVAMTVHESRQWPEQPNAHRQQPVHDVAGWHPAPAVPVVDHVQPSGSPGHSPHGVTLPAPLEEPLTVPEPLRPFYRTYAPSGSPGHGVPPTVSARRDHSQCARHNHAMPMRHLPVAGTLLPTVQQSVQAPDQGKPTPASFA